MPSHAHLAEFTDHVTPSDQRYADITDPASGNYAFVWDYKGRSIVHPRHHSIVGYDPETGEQVEPWLEDRIYAEWKTSGKPYRTFINSVPTFRDQGLDKKPSLESIKQGHVGLDCRYLNFAPQCIGWYQLTQHGGSGSFVILWTGLWKLTTAAAIPYYTGTYGKSPRGFGFVTIGANVDEFHAPANASKEKLDRLIVAADNDMKKLGEESQTSIREGLGSTARKLIVSTAIMVAAVIGIAIWLASSITQRIIAIIVGIGRFESGERSFRFATNRKDEIGKLQTSFDRMADTIGDNLQTLEGEIAVRQQTEDELRSIRDNLEQLVEERTASLSSTNEMMRKEVADRIDAENRANFLAAHDPLTGLPNRSQFNDHLTTAIAMAIRHQEPMALFFMDLDDFKSVNDTHGHDIGDKLLQAVACALKSRIRESDSAFRLGGDEFAVILRQVSSPESAASVATAIIEALANPIDIEGCNVTPGVSIGISLVPGDTDNPDELLLHTDLAMYEAKENGGKCFHFFSQTMHQGVIEKKRTIADIRQAIQREEFTPYFQPRIDTRWGRVDGAEVLARWRHAERGWLTPDCFIDLAEENGLLVQIDDLILRLACDQAVKWRSAGLFSGRIAVNISARQLAEDNFVEKVLNALSASGLPPDQLEIELTESAIMRDIDKSISALAKLREANVLVALDDFGTDYSSLGRLIECTIDIIKIDRFFVSRIGHPKHEAIISAIVTMTDSIGAMLVAEGVETKEQLDFLRQRGCHLVQGYYYAPALDANEFTAFIARQDHSSRP